MLLHCGTIWVHGRAARVPVTEDEPRTAYGEYGTGKAAIEELLHRETRSGGVPAIVLHPGHISGPGWQVVNPLGNLDSGVWQALASGAELETARLSVSALGEAATPVVWDKLDIAASVPANAKQLTITIFDTRQKLVKTITEASPRAGERTFSWDFKTADGKDAGVGQFIHRVNIDGAATSAVVERPARATPEDLAAQVVTMIQNVAPSAMRAHGRLMLPDATGTPVKLQSLFAKPVELMAALVRGGWIIPGEADRSMFLVAIIGTGPNRGPMKTKLAQADVDLLTDWVNAGAVIPAAVVS